MDHRPSVELLESIHFFPGVYKIKAIGRAEDDFESRVVEAVYSHVAAPSDLGERAELTRIGTAMEGAYGKGKYCPTRDRCLDL